MFAICARDVRTHQVHVAFIETIKVSVSTFATEEVLSLEVEIERRSLQGLITVARELTRQNQNASHDTFNGPREDVVAPVLEVLPPDDEVEQVALVLAEDGKQFRAAAAKVWVGIKLLPHVVDGRNARCCANVVLGAQERVEGRTALKNLRCELS